MDSADYNIADYPPFAVTVDLVAFAVRGEELCVLLVRRTGEPFKDAWALPGGFVQRFADGLQESLDEAAAREFEEETGLPLNAAYLTQLGAYGDPNRDPRGNVVTVAYLAVAPSMESPRAGGDAAEARWLPVALVLETSEIAFDHARIILDAAERLRELVETTALAVALCDEAFTVSHLRRVYEIVWDLPADTLDAGNFHNRVLNMQLVEPVESLGLEAEIALLQERLKSLSHRPGRRPQFFKAGALVDRGGPAARLPRPFERPSLVNDREREVMERPDSAPTARESKVLPPVARPPGMQQQVWDAAMKQARRAIWERGMAGECIYYGDLAREAGVYWFSAAFFTVLDAVCVEEVAAGGPLVTVLVMNRRTQMPGARFFVLARKLGREFGDEREFVAEERQRAFEWIQAHPVRSH
jgi:8-oxo-dGTP diphosphatase